MTRRRPRPCRGAVPCRHDHRWPRLSRRGVGGVAADPIDGSIRAADANLQVTTDSTIIIPGHGQPVSNRAELKAFRDMLFAIRGNVAALKKQGHSLDAIIAAKPTEAFDDRWGRFVIETALFTRLVYQGV